MPVKIKITDSRDIPTIDTAGKLTNEVLITYVVDGVRIYQTRVPKAQSDLASVQKRIEAEERERLKLINQEFELK